MCGLYNGQCACDAGIYRCRWCGSWVVGQEPTEPCPACGRPTADEEED